MSTGIKSQVAKQTKTLAQQIAKQVAQEPLEVLKAGTPQVAGMEKGAAQPPRQGQVAQAQPATAPVDIEALKQQDQARSRQLHENLEREIKEIREKEQQKRILQAQVQAQAEVSPEEKIKPLAQPGSRPSRKLFSFGPKADAERKKTRVERPLPPTG